MKTYQVIWSEKAKEDLLRIYDFIYNQSPQGADKVFDVLLDLGDSLDKLPYRFPIEDLMIEAKNEYRFISKWSYKIIFFVDEKNDQVIITQIFGTAQNPERLYGK